MRDGIDVLIKENGHIMNMPSPSDNAPTANAAPLKSISKSAGAAAGQPGHGQPIANQPPPQPTRYPPGQSTIVNDAALSFALLVQLDARGTHKTPPAPQKHYTAQWKSFADDCFGTSSGVGPLVTYKQWNKEPHNNLRKLCYAIADHFNEEYTNRTTKDGSEKDCDEIHILAHKIYTERHEAFEEHTRMKARDIAEKAKAAAEKRKMEGHLNLTSPGRGQTPPRGTGQLTREQKAGLDALHKNPTSGKGERASVGQPYCCCDELTNFELSLASFLDQGGYQH